MAISESTGELICEYFSAFVNLYNIISLKRAFRIINSQNPELELDEADFRAFVNSLELEDKFYTIAYDEEMLGEKTRETDVMKKLIIAEHLYSVDDSAYDELKQIQEGRRFYIPDREELLKYADDFYYEITDAHVNMVEFLLKEFKFSESDAVDVVQDCVGFTQILTDEDDDSCDFLLERMSDFKFKGFKNDAQEDRFYELYDELFKHTRLPMYRGFMPCEITK